MLTLFASVLYGYGFLLLIVVLCVYNSVGCYGLCVYSSPFYLWVVNWCYRLCSLCLLCCLLVVLRVELLFGYVVVV